MCFYLCDVKINTIAHSGSNSNGKADPFEIPHGLLHGERVLDDPLRDAGTCLAPKKKVFGFYETILWVLPHYNAEIWLKVLVLRVFISSG